MLLYAYLLNLSFLFCNLLTDFRELQGLLTLVNVSTNQQQYRILEVTAWWYLTNLKKVFFNECIKINKVGHMTCWKGN